MPDMTLAAALDAMVRETRAPKVNDWFVNYVAKKCPLAEELRLRWFGDADPTVAAAPRRSHRSGSARSSVAARADSVSCALVRRRGRRF